jgi:hypothetical protein
MRGPWRLAVAESGALVVDADKGDAALDLIRALGLGTGVPTIALVGGAAGMSDVNIARTRALLTQAVVPLVEEIDGAIVDGGTDAGIMRAVGDARVELGASFPLVGVAVRQLVAFDHDRSPGAAPPAPGHTHFVRVPGVEWGDEAPWLAAVAGASSGVAPSLTVLVNGGEVAWADARASVDAARPLFVLAGSGRTADALAAAARGEDSDPRGRALVETGLVHALSFDDPREAAAILRCALASSSGP